MKYSLFTSLLRRKGKPPHRAITTTRSKHEKPRGRATVYVRLINGHQSRSRKSNFPRADARCDATRGNFNARKASIIGRPARRYFCHQIGNFRDSGAEGLLSAVELHPSLRLFSGFLRFLEERKKVLTNPLRLLINYAHCALDGEEGRIMRQNISAMARPLISLIAKKNFYSLLFVTGSCQRPLCVREKLRPKSKSAGRRRRRLNRGTFVVFCTTSERRKKTNSSLLAESSARLLRPHPSSFHRWH